MLAVLRIAILGGWLIMMGQHDRSESLFYYFRIEECNLQRNGATVD
jgi:hypothetical protein